jgi:cytoskeletal protein RodZ
MSTTLKNNASAIGLGGNNSKKKSKWWLWLLILLVVAVIVFFVFKKYSNDKPIPTDTPTIPVTVVDSTENTNVGSGDAVSEEQNTTENKDEQVENNGSPESDETTSVPHSATDYDAEARTAVRGTYGNGQSRKDVLGEKYSEVQRKVNEGKGVWWNPID